MGSTSDKLVAVVDDESSVLESIANLLASAGFGTVTFRSAAELLEWDQLCKVDCLVSDIRMPGMDGWQLVAQLRRRQKHLPAVLMTAHDPFESAEHEVLAGAAVPEILRKPFEPQRLLDAIHRALDVARQP